MIYFDTIINFCYIFQPIFFSSTVTDKIFIDVNRMYTACRESGSLVYLEEVTEVDSAKTPCDKYYANPKRIL